MMNEVLGLLVLCFAGFATAGYYSPYKPHGPPQKPQFYPPYKPQYGPPHKPKFVKPIKPNFIPPQKPNGCLPPKFKDGTYSPEIPSGICGYGTVLYFKCKPGYVLAGAKHARCTYSGHWDPPHIPICKKLDICKYKNPCGPHSKCVETKGKVTCVCDKGYMSKGKDCIKIDICKYKNPCGPHSKCVETYGKVTCVCDTGYITKGNKCMMKQCFRPKLSDHCDYSPKFQKSWYPGQKIKFVCPPGYELKGYSYATCLTGGKWDRGVPICKKKIQCKVPVMPHYCSYTPRYQVKWGYGEKINFHCPSGYKRIGSAYATCSQDGKWDAYPPKCERPKYCDVPRLPENCGYTPTKQYNWKVGSKINFHCPVGYEMVGSSYATCIDHGTWDKKPPICKRPIMCHPPPVKPGCTYKPNFVAWHSGQKIHFKCPYGHKMVGYDYATCKDDGSWDRKPPICQPPKLCYLPKLSDKVYQTYSQQKSWKVGQKIHFACPVGYKMKGSAYAVCNEDGHWGNGPPACIKLVSCYLPKLHDKCGYGPYDKKSWKVGEKILFHCPTGYELKGSAYSVCQHDGSWNFESPTCYKRDVCYVPHMSKYLSVNDPHHLKYFEVGHKMQFICPKGYYLDGKEYAVCLPGGKWDTPTPVCARKKCEVPHMPKYCTYQPQYQVAWYPGNKMNFYCPYGYEMKGKAYAMCTYDGKWDNPPPTCYKKPVYCKAPTLQPSCHCKMSSTYKPYYKPGEMTQFVCPPGFKLKGYKVAKCLYNGYWSHPTPVCYKPNPIKYGYGIQYLKKFW